MLVKNEKIVLSTGVRTPIGHFSKALSPLSAEDLLELTLKQLLTQTKVSPDKIDGVIAGWVGQGSSAPNIARIALLKAGLAEKSQALTIQANCVSGMEAVCSSARHIFSGEGNLYIAAGTESMTSFPYTIGGARSLKSLRSKETLQENWNSLWQDPAVSISDSIEEGLTDPVKNINMAATAEVCAQLYSIKKEEQDAYARQSFLKTLAAWKNGFYQNHTFPLQRNGSVLLDHDEYAFLRESLAQKPAMFAKAPLLFDSSAMGIQDFYKTYGQFIEGKTYSPQAQATVTLFNACARSDGAAAIFVTSESFAKKMGLPILAELYSWAFWGNNPAHMGVAPVYATQKVLERSGISFDAIDSIELHEAFAATCLSIFKLGQDQFGQQWQKKYEEGRINPNGGSIALGHPLAATGTRIVLNALAQMQTRPEINYSLATACAAGGLGGAILLKRYA